MAIKWRVLLLADNRQYLDLGAQVNGVVFGRENRRVWRCKMFSLALASFNDFGEPIEAQNDILWLRGKHRHLAVTRLQDIFVCTHNIFRLPLRFFRERHMHRHLVAIEVSVECVTHERMKLDGVAFNEARTKCLNALAMERRRAVKEHILTGNCLFKNLPDFCDAVFNETSRAANVECKLSF